VPVRHTLVGNDLGGIAGMLSCCELPQIECVCPLGHQGCPLVEEVERLQAECRRLAELSHTDPLTGVFNYRHLIVSLEQEMERTRRTELPTALIMIDLDHFKLVNDRYGHTVGDAALRWVCQLWGRNVRRLDTLCRYGGEEFALILPGSRMAAAVQTARRLQKTLAASPLHYEGYEIPLTASFGVDVYRGEMGVGAIELIKRADEFLRLAKVQGRNRCCYRQQRAQSLATEVSAAERAALFPPAGGTYARETG